MNNTKQKILPTIIDRIFCFGTSIHNVLGIKTPARIRIFNPYRRDIFVSVIRNEVLS